MNYLKRLNPKQKEATLATEGKTLILAGAGSGKTSVLIARIVYLIEELAIPPSQILGLTFTNKAAREMQERICRFVDKKIAKQVHLSTFHSFCFHLLKKEIHHLGYTDKFSIYDENDIRRILQSLFKEHSQDGEGIAINEDILNNIKKIQLGEAPTLDSNHKASPLLKDVTNDLASSLRAFNAVDFDGLILLTIELFEKYPSILEKYQKQYRYIMVDEYQDTNSAQYQVVNLLSLSHRNLCVVGDDDQSIYGWRGAKVKHILEFDYTTLIKLEQNYRSTKPILDAANHLIKHNQERHNKTLWSSHQEEGFIHIFHAPNEANEAEGVVARMLKLRKERTLRWSDMAILYRSNVLTRPLEVALMNAHWRSEENEFRRGIPYKIAEGSEWYSRAEIKDMLAYLKLIVNPHDGEALLRIINYPRRGISNQTIDTLTKINRSEKTPLIDVLYDVAYKGLYVDQLSSSARGAIGEFLNLIENARHAFEEKPLKEAMQNLLHATGYLAMIDLETKTEKGATFKKGNIEELTKMMEQYQTEAENPSLHDFIHTSILDSRYLGENRKNTEAVNLLTFHSAKGLEFEACFIIGAEDHLIPHEKSVLETGIEEERRLLYVAMTRAKAHLTFSMARHRNRYGKMQPSTPSRFLYEIPKDLFQTSSWDHPGPC